MRKTLDIAPLRSLVAIADAGGFHRAAAVLDLTQSAVSQHVRRLEAVIGEALVEPDGRATRFTATGEALLAEARQILDAHDQALRRLAVLERAQLVIGTTEHAADRILPPIMAALEANFPELQAQFRFDRTAKLNRALDEGKIDLAVFVAEASHEASEPIGTLDLRWCAAPHLAAPAPGEPWPLVAIQAPCAIRTVALRTLAESGIAAAVVGEAGYLAGVVNAARAGVGAVLLALDGPPPEGLVELTELPPAPPIHLSARVRRGAEGAATDAVLEVLSDTLSPSVAEDPGDAAVGDGSPEPVAVPA
jgi:DNA-binding transcriptional LysR family regulator